MNRRTWFKTSGSGVAALLISGSGSLLLSGCNVIASIKAYIPVGIAAFSGVVSLLSGLGIIPPGTGTVIALLVGLVKSGFADLMAAIDQYNAAPAADKATLLAKVSLILSDVSRNIGKFFSDLTINDTTVLTLVTGLVQLILSTLAGFAAQLPPAPTPVALTAKVSGHPITITPKILSRSAFVKQFNQIVTAGGHPEMVLT
jgi:hypothetical protein